MTLYVVSTPVGNLEDITLRALRILKEADLVLAEDTRRTLKLFKKYEIKNRLESYNDFSKEKKTSEIIKLLKQEKDIAIVSDSGTPGISDPGFYLVRECTRNDIRIVPVPGAAAFLAGLVCSGLPTDKFTFYGFLPKSEKRKKEMLKKIEHTSIFYESPHRVLNTLKIMDEVIPERQLVVARELTKKFEEYVRGTVKEVYDTLKDKTPKGEIVLIVS